MKILAFILATSALNIAHAQDSCGWATSRMPNPIKDAHYMRVDPTGSYLILTREDKTVSILDLKNLEGNKPTALKTPMASEAYPVEGESQWRLIASPYDKKKGIRAMRYYGFDKLKKDSSAREEFADEEHDEFYHSSAVVDGADTDQIRVRTMLWSGNRIRDYSFKFSSEGQMQAETLQTREVCKNITTPVLSAEQIQERDTLLTVREELSLKYFRAKSEDQEQIKAEYHRVSRRLDPLLTKHFNQPILSKDGQLIAAIGTPEETTKVFRIKDNADCELVKDTGVRTSKVSFSYPEKGRLPKFVYTFEGGPSNGFRRAVGLYDLQTGKESVVTTEAETYYPGLTRDGRVFALNAINNEILILTPTCGSHSGQSAHGAR